MKFNSLGDVGDRKLLLSLVLFPCSFLLIFYSALCLFVPGFFPEVPYVLLNFLLFSLLTCLAFFLPGLNALYLIGVYVILLVPVLVTASYVATYGQPMNGQSFFFIWETNLGEALEFIKNARFQSPKMIFFPIASILLPLLPLMYLLKKRKLPRQMKPLHRYALAASCLIVLLVLCGTGKANSNVAYQFYYSFFSYQKDLILARNLSDSALERIKDIKITSSRPDDAKETYIVVIGESASRHHMSLYGYNSMTDPRMVALNTQGSLVAFDNVNAIDGGTTKSLLNALSFKDQFTPFSTFKFSVIDVFNAAKFKTYWFSNNAVMLFYDTMLHSLSRNATMRQFTEARNADLKSLIDNNNGSIAFIRDRKAKNEEDLTFDSALLPWVDEALSSKENKKIIFVHLKGSHILYWYRFPNAFEKFKGREGISPKPFMLNDDDVKIINDYDNSIYYTDHILNELVKKLQATEGESWLLYFSDHGEEMYDFRRKAGRDPTNLSKYMLDIPFMVWFSKDYKKARDTTRMKEYTERAFDLDSLIYAIMDLANLKTDLLDRSRSIFSDKYKVPARMIVAEPYVNMPPQGLNNLKTISGEIKAVEEFIKMKSLEE